MNPSQKKFRAKPPDKGSFPLDHEGECKQFKERYMDCLKKNNSDHFYCRDLAKDYLLCRMDRDLMVKEDCTKLGFRQHTENNKKTQERGEKDNKNP